MSIETGIIYLTKARAASADVAGAGAPDEIELTQEMIEAGAATLQLEYGPLPMARSVASAVYGAMREAARLSDAKAIAERAA